MRKLTKAVKKKLVKQYAKATNTPVEELVGKNFIYAPLKAGKYAEGSTVDIKVGKV